MDRRVSLPASRIKVSKTGGLERDWKNIVVVGVASIVAIVVIVMVFMMSRGDMQNTCGDVYRGSNERRWKVNVPVDHTLFAEPYGGEGNHPLGYGAVDTPYFRYLDKAGHGKLPPPGEVVKKIERNVSEHRHRRELETNVDGYSNLLWMFGRFLALDMFGERASHVNPASSFIDGSQLYGYKQELMDGILLDATRVANQRHCVENAGIWAMCRLWAEEHNHWARQIRDEHEKWSDMEVFQLARTIVISEMQGVAYEEWMPTLLGNDARPDFAVCYQGQLGDPRAYEEFVFAGFQFPLFLMTRKLETRNPKTGSSVAREFHSYRRWNPEEHKDEDHAKIMSEILLGAAHQLCKRKTVFLIEELRPRFEKLLERGRARNIAGYNTLRQFFGGEPVTHWRDITWDEFTAQRLDDAYGTHGWREMDALPGLVAEEPYPGSLLGYTLRSIIFDQLSRARAADAYTYPWNPAARSKRVHAHSCTLTSILCRSSQIECRMLPLNVFYV